MVDGIERDWVFGRKFMKGHLLTITLNRRLSRKTLTTTWNWPWRQALKVLAQWSCSISIARWALYEKDYVLWYFDSLRWMVTMWRLSWTLVLKQQLCPRYHISLQTHRLGGDPFVSCQAAAERCGIMRLVDTRWAGIAKGVGTQKILGIGICAVFLICINIETNIVFLVWKFHFDLLRNIFLQGGFTWPRSR